MRLAFAADLHGSQRHLSGFLELARQEKAAAAIIGGDLLPVSRPLQAMLDAQQQYVRAIVRDLLSDHWSLGGCPVFIQPGNNDCRSAIEVIQEVQDEGLVAMPGPHIGFLVEGYVIVSLPYVPPTPFRLKDYDRRDLPGDQAPEQPNPVCFSTSDQVREAEIRDYLSRHPSIQEYLEQLKLEELEREKTIYVMHSPPFGTGLDRMAGGIDVGSRAIRDAIETHQPLLTLHGHIHEAPAVFGAFACRLGQTVSVNPGQSVGQLQAAIVDVGIEIGLRHTTLGSLTPSELRRVNRLNS